MEKVFFIVLFSAIMFHFWHALRYRDFINKSNRISKRAKKIHGILIWIIPFIWFWFIKEHIRPMQTMTKAKRNLDKSNYYESGKGIVGP